MNNLTTLGDRYRDQVTGVTGIAFARVDTLSGMQRIALAPGLDANGAKRESHWCDVQCLQYVEQGSLRRQDVEQEPGFDTFALGAKVRCKVTKLEGTAIARAIHVTGCVQYELQPEKDKEGKLPESVYLDWKQLEEIERPPVDIKPQRTGGFYNDKFKY